MISGGLMVVWSVVLCWVVMIHSDDDGTTGCWAMERSRSTGGGGVVCVRVYWVPVMIKALYYKTAHFFRKWFQPCRQRGSKVICSIAVTVRAMVAVTFDLRKKTNPKCFVWRRDVMVV